jgi:hypothetical protein
MDPINLSEFADEPPARDFRRANGAPMVKRLDDPTKWDRYSRPSGWGSDLDDESNLVLWRIDRAMDGVASSPALAAGVAAKKGIKEGRKELRDQAILLGRGDEAADMGTALHAMSHRLETEDGFVAPEPYAADLAAYLMMLDAAGLKSRFIEVQVCSDQWRAAGTTDRIYETTRELRLPDGSVVPPGTMFIGDLKTGKSLDYSLPGFCIQLAIYCDGCFYDVETNERSEFPPSLHTGWGVLVHLPVGAARCDLMWADLSVGREGAAIVQLVRKWRKRDDFAQPFELPVSDEVTVLSETVALSTTSDAPNFTGLLPDDDEWTDAMAQWCQARINVIGAIPEARALLLRRWPSSVPPLRDGYTAAGVSEILDLIAAIEGAFSLPFPVGDPRPEWNRGLARREGVAGHQPPSATQEQLNS